MLGAVSRYSPWNHLATFGDEQSERLWIFVVNDEAAVGAIPADFPSVIGRFTSILVKHYFSPLHLVPFQYSESPPFLQSPPLPSQPTLSCVSPSA